MRGKKSALGQPNREDSVKSRGRPCIHGMTGRIVTSDRGALAARALGERGVLISGTKMPNLQKSQKFGKRVARMNRARRKKGRVTLAEFNASLPRSTLVPRPREDDQ